MNYFVTAIGTDSGKTVTSAIMVEMLKADYWKPIQAGSPRDTEMVQSLISNKESKLHPEKYLLNTPASPHAAAKIDHVRLDLNAIVPPATNRDLVIEGAGGIMVPINEREVILDMIKKTDCEVVLVSDFYLGSINHTLLTAEILKNNNLKVKGIIFNGKMNIESESIILKRTGYRKLLHIDQEERIDRKTVRLYAEKLKLCWE